MTKTRNNKSPCLDCQDRKIKCHSTCEHYKRWQMEQSENKDIVLKAKQEISDVRAYMRASWRGIKGGKRKNV